MDCERGVWRPRPDQARQTTAMAAAQDARGELALRNKEELGGVGLAKWHLVALGRSKHNARASSIGVGLAWLG
jgi:hypothetical protein